MEPIGASFLDKTTQHGSEERDMQELTKRLREADINNVSDGIGMLLLLGTHQDESWKVGQIWNAFLSNLKIIDV